MLWAALRLPAEATAPPTDALRGLSLWALQFTPRVALRDEAVVMELASSVRLFGGKRALRDRITAESKELGVVAVAWAPNSIAGLALARAGVESGFRPGLTEVLDRLPMQTLTAGRSHLVTLSQLGCQTLGDLRRLPRGGLVRRFDSSLLSALDQAYGLRPEAHEWLSLPDTFEARLELPFRVEVAPALLYGARRLLLQLCGWLAARHAGTTAIRLRWMHDAMRPRSADPGDELIVRTATATRDLEHLCRLLAENLAKITLQAPAGDLVLEALDVQPLDERSASLLPDVVHEGETLALVLERIAARLGPDKVLRPVLNADHRVEWMQHWQPASQPLPRRPLPATDLPQPTRLFPEPIRLAMSGPRPMYQGVLQLLTGPHRIEGGWWHRVEGEDGPCALQLQRDYWLALSPHAGALWVFQTRLDDEWAWYLHGTFA
ncbi:DNA polymerase Y family protein [Aquincola sp. MAHUQ-54]|uniref:DNA polymerase Y family protein n=1 Tax=Aquincola agrisoli TaxID=3119538 RepID=A0AAW9QQT2_9BURK